MSRGEQIAAKDGAASGSAPSVSAPPGEESEEPLSGFSDCGIAAFAFRSPRVAATEKSFLRPNPRSLGKERKPLRIESLVLRRRRFQGAPLPFSAYCPAVLQRQI